MSSSHINISTFLPQAYGRYLSLETPAHLKNILYKCHRSVRVYSASKVLSDTFTIFECEIRFLSSMSDICRLNAWITILHRTHKREW